jgi:hypothetical protein
MKRMKKKGWLRIMEAVIAILIVFGVVIYVVSKQNYTPDRTQEIYEKADYVLEIISKNDTLRQMFIDDQKDKLEQEISKLMPASWNFSTCIVSNILLICSTPTPRDKEVYVKEVLIVSTIQKYSPKKLRLFIWMK